MDIKEARRLDRLEAAYHEAGHGIVAVALGVQSAKLTVWYHEPKDASESHSGGLTELSGAYSPGKLDRASISFAGPLAQLLLEDNSINLEDFYSDPLEYVSCGLSETDAVAVNAIHPSWRLRAVRKALAILKHYWIVVDDIARELAVNKDARQWVLPYMLLPEHLANLASETSRHQSDGWLPHPGTGNRR